MEECCGTTCDKAKLIAELKAKGATEFVEFFEANVTEDCSTEEVAKLLAYYIMTL